MPTKLRARLPQAPGRSSRHHGGGDRQAQDETVHIFPIDVREVPADHVGHQRRVAWQIPSPIHEWLVETKMETEESSTSPSTRS